MAKNQRYTNALHISIPAPYAVKSGEPVKAGGICGVAQIDAANGAPVTVWLDGSYDLEVTGAVAKVGDVVYITAAGKLNTTALANTAFGIALGNKGAPAGPVEVAPLGYNTAVAGA